MPVVTIVGALEALPSRRARKIISPSQPRNSHVSFTVVDLSGARKRRMVKMCFINSSLLSKGLLPLPHKVRHNYPKLPDSIASLYQPFYTQRAAPIILLLLDRNHRIQIKLVSAKGNVPLRHIYHSMVGRYISRPVLKYIMQASLFHCTSCRCSLVLNLLLYCIIWLQQSLVCRR